MENKVEILNEENLTDSKAISEWEETKMIEQQKPIRVYNEQPLADKVLVKKINAAETSAHGVIIPDISQDKETTFGEVVGVGRGILTIDGKVAPNECQLGDIIKFVKYEAYKVELEEDPDHEYVVVKETNILTRIPMNSKIM